MPIILFDNAHRKKLFPLTVNKAVGALFYGMLTMQKRWELLSSQPVALFTDNYLQSLYPLPSSGEHLWIDAAIIPEPGLVQALLSLAGGTCLVDGFGLIGGKGNVSPDAFRVADSVSLFSKVQKITDVKRLEYPWQLMLWNAERIQADFPLVTAGRDSQPIPRSVNVTGMANIFIEEGARLNHCTLNARDGHIYIGKDAEIMEGSAIRGPFVLGEQSVLKLNSRIYGATSLGPRCVGGGEIKNTVMMGYSNKGHDGYLGDSVIGEWCNFGAGSTVSNVKNNAGTVRVWDMDSETYQPVGQKCGVIMGDYSRVAINSAINTGSVIGMGCNVFGKGLLPTILPNFSWGVEGVRYDFNKAVTDIDNWKKMKQHALGEAETSLLAFIFDNL